MTEQRLLREPQVLEREKEGREREGRVFLRAEVTGYSVVLRVWIVSDDSSRDVESWREEKGVETCSQRGVWVLR